MTIGNRNSVGGARRVPSAPSIGTLMEMLSVQQSTLSPQNGGANSTFSEEDLAAGGGPSRLSITSQTDDTESVSGRPSTLGQRRPSDRSAVSAGRALLANKSPSAKVTRDGTLYYEVKTSSGDPEQEGSNKERRAPRRRRRTRAVQDAGSPSNDDREQQPESSAGPPRKNGSFLGRSRDSFLLKLMARETTGC